MAALLLSKVALWFLVSAASALQFTVQPTTIEIGLTTSLDLRCSFNHATDTELASLVSLFISRSGDLENIDYQEIASVNSFSGNFSNVLHSNATVTGFINNQGQSYLTMHWQFPGNREAGLYKCVANGVDGTGHPVSVMSTGQITSEVPSTAQLVEELRNLKINMNYALDNICISGCWQTRLELMKNARFEISSLYKGRRYLLSKIANIASAPVAQESCELYGGYLAEIDDVDELQFVQNFIKTRSSIDYKMVLIGGTDDGHEHAWYYQRDGRPMTYTNWAPGQPIVDTSTNCVYLWADFSWLMDDFVCLQLDRTFNPRYLCEVPEP